MARVITKLASLEIPEEPRTTFNVGLVRGGRSVNAIAQECVAQVEFRSLEPDRVAALEREFRRITEGITAPELKVSVELIGTRPGGLLPPENLLVQTVAAAAEYLGLKAELCAASTDAALALARGIPSICMGTYRGNGVHTLQEKVETDSLTTGFKWLALTVLALAGIDN
jgi:acetylornithine deacetylase/succinyl-diaminopimelate desuccinylase-like protein